MRSSVLLFASSLALASAQADEMAKEGVESSTIYYVMLSSSGDSVEWAGIRRIDSGDARNSTRWAFAARNMASNVATAP